MALQTSGLRSLVTNEDEFGNEIYLLNKGLLANAPVVPDPEDGVALQRVPGDNLHYKRQFLPHFELNIVLYLVH